MFVGAVHGGFSGVSGLYFIGCGERLIYIGQSISLAQRSIESMAKYYHRIDDLSLPWSIGIAPYRYNDPDIDLNELESTAIRKYAPIFNTSIPSKAKSKGADPVITNVFRVFSDQQENCAAFNSANMAKQASDAAMNESPPWSLGHKRKK